MGENSKKDYNNGRIYCIRNHITDDIYVGSTTQALSKRMQKHKFSMKYERDNKTLVYQKMNELGAEHFYIELIEEYECENIEQLRKREGEVIRELKPSLNKRVEDRTIQEWREDNKQKMQEYHKQYREEHNDELKEKNKIYREEHREQISDKKKESYYSNHEEILQQRQEHRDNNREHIRALNNTHYNKHKEKTKRQENTQCICGVKCSVGNMSAHKNQNTIKNMENFIRK